MADNSAGANNQSVAPVRKSRRRSKGGARGRSAGWSQKPFRQPQRLFASVDLASPDAVEQIHQASLKVLAEIGIKVLHPGARSIMKEAGAQVDDATQQVFLMQN